MSFTHIDSSCTKSNILLISYNVIIKVWILVGKTSTCTTNCISNKFPKKNIDKKIKYTMHTQFFLINLNFYTHSSYTFVYFSLMFLFLLVRWLIVVVFNCTKFGGSNIWCEDLVKSYWGKECSCIEKTLTLSRLIIVSWVKIYLFLCYL